MGYSSRKPSSLISRPLEGTRMKVMIKRRLPRTHLLAVAIAAVSFGHLATSEAQESPAPSSRLTSIFAGGVPETVADLKEMESWQQSLP